MTLEVSLGDEFLSFRAQLPNHAVERAGDDAAPFVINVPPPRANIDPAPNTDFLSRM